MTLRKYPSRTNAFEIRTPEALAAFFWNNPALCDFSLSEYEGKELPELPQSLRKLHLLGCNALTSLPPLPDQLYMLSIESCDELAVIPTPEALGILYLTDLPKLQTLSLSGFQLHDLSIESCHQLTKIEEFPESITDLVLLKCTKLTSLPGLPNLDSLIVDSCSIEELVLPDILESVQFKNCLKLKTVIQLKPGTERIEFEGCPLVKLITAE